MFYIESAIYFFLAFSTIEPVLSGTLFSGHPTLNDHSSKSLKNIFHFIAVIFTSVKQPPLLIKCHFRDKRG